MMKLNILQFITEIKKMNSLDYQFRAHKSAQRKKIWFKGFNPIFVPGGSSIPFVLAPFIHLRM